jgi:hypothetical protein
MGRFFFCRKRVRSYVKNNVSAADDRPLHVFTNFFIVTIIPEYVRGCAVFCRLACEQPLPPITPLNSGNQGIKTAQSYQYSTELSNTNAGAMGKGCFAWRMRPAGKADIFPLIFDCVNNGGVPSYPKWSCSP